MFRHSRTFLLLSLILTIPLSCSTPAAPQAGQSTFESFWRTFREASLKKDVEQIASITRFPFVTKGQLDDDETRQHTPESFKELFPRLLDEDAGMSAQPESMLKYIERRADAAADGESARVGSFVFEKTGAGWRFVLAYTDNP